jgi:hypothetical protein
MASDLAVYHAHNHSHVNDLDCWLNCMSDRPELPILQVALKEYQFSLLAVAIGLYRHAFMGLRLYGELLLAGVQMSANELDLRLWLANRQDTAWGTIIDQESGVFSKTFVGAFCPELEPAAPSYRALAEKSYRSCSQHVHGNPCATELVPEGISFSEDAFRTWQDTARAMRRAASFALTARYFHGFTSESQQRLEPIITDELGHEAVVIALLETRTGDRHG